MRHRYSFGQRLFIVAVLLTLAVIIVKDIAHNGGCDGHWKTLTLQSGEQFEICWKGKP